MQNLVSNKKNQHVISGKKSPSFFIDSDSSSHDKRNKFDQAVIVNSCEQRMDSMSDKLRKERRKRINLEKIVEKSSKELDDVKVKLLFLEEKINSAFSKNSNVSTKSNIFFFFLNEFLIKKIKMMILN